MKRCLQLASLGKGNVAPNPLVGAVLVYNDIVIGEGYHQHFGKAHAEVNCINSVSPQNITLIDQSTLYVSLEPCVHFGKTPPCTDIIIEKKIPKVVIGCIDIYNEVAGKGIEKLKNAGIDVSVGVMKNEAIEINKRFFTFHQKQRPYIILKWAQTFNKKIAHLNNGRLLITNQFTNILVHQWRAEESSIMIGTNTALKDNPALTVRNCKGNNPIRLVIDLNLKLPSHLQLFDNTVKTIVFNYETNVEEENLILIKLDKEREVIVQVLEKLYQLKIQSVIVEGGAMLLQSFINQNFWDEARVITNSSLQVADGLNAPNFPSNIVYRNEKIETDSISYFINPSAK